MLASYVNVVFEPLHGENTGVGVDADEGVVVSLEFFELVAFDVELVQVNMVAVRGNCKLKFGQVLFFLDEVGLEREHIHVVLDVLVIDDLLSFECVGSNSEEVFLNDDSNEKSRGDLNFDDTAAALLHRFVDIGVEDCSGHVAVLEDFVREEVAVLCAKDELAAAAGDGSDSVCDAHVDCLLFEWVFRILV